MKFKTFYWLSHYGIFNKSQYTIISKYGKRTRQLKFKKKLKNFPLINNNGQRKSFRIGVEWRGSHWTIRKRNTREHKESHWQNVAWKYFKVKFENCFDNLSIRVSQRKTV